MTTKSEIQDLLRFLTQDAKVPLRDAMPKIKELQKANLITYAQQDDKIVMSNGSSVPINSPNPTFQP